MRPLPDCFVGTAAFRFAALTNDAFNKAFREMGGKVFCSISQQNDRLFYEFVNFDCCSRSLRTICMGRAGQNHVSRMRWRRPEANKNKLLLFNECCKGAKQFPKINPSNIHKHWSEFLISLGKSKNFQELHITAHLFDSIDAHQTPYLKGTSRATALKTHRP